MGCVMPSARGRTTAAAWLLAVAIAMTISADAWAIEKRACFAAHEQGQVDQKARKLKAAAAQFLICSVDECPPVIREECGKWLSDIRSAIPTVVPTALGRDGRDATEVQVFVDGQLLTERLAGGSFEVDPGEHQFRFVLTDGTAIDQKYVINEGDSRRKIAADFSAAQHAAPQPSAHPVPSGDGSGSNFRVPVSAYVLGGLGVVALGSFTAFALSGKSKENDLKSNCAPHCPESEVSVMDNRYLAADISLGVGIASLGVAAWILLSSNRAPSTPSAWVDVVPTQGAAQVRWTKRF
jgi:hypothetical protein